MPFDLIFLFILAFAAFRITRFFIIDSLFDGSREKLHVFLGNRARKDGWTGVLWDKALDLSSCTWCFGFWVCLTLYSLYFWVCPLNFSRIDVIQVFAVAGVQGLLHAWEPSDG